MARKVGDLEIAAMQASEPEPESPPPNDDSFDSWKTLIKSHDGISCRCSFGL
jgi:hypothetical protein